MSSTRKHAHKRQDIFKKSYEEIIKSAKRKHSNDFYIFKTVVGNDVWYSECSIDVTGNSLEHWEKVDGKWLRKNEQKAGEA